MTGEGHVTPSASQDGGVRGGDRQGGAYAGGRVAPALLSPSPSPSAFPLPCPEGPGEVGPQASQSRGRQGGSGEVPSTPTSAAAGASSSCAPTETFFTARAPALPVLLRVSLPLLHCAPSHTPVGHAITDPDEGRNTAVTVLR